MIPRRSNLGMDGIDPVEYLCNHTWTLGKPEFKQKFNGITYCFVNKPNMELFVVNPARYVPQFDGACALRYSLTGKSMLVTPENALVLDGKLYLFESSAHKLLCKLMPFLLTFGHNRYNKIKIKK